MRRLGQGDETAGLEAAGESFDRRRGNNAVGTGDDDEHRSQRAARIIGIFELPHQAQGGVRPAHSWIADGEFGRGLNDRDGARVTRPIGSHDVLGERLEKERSAVTAGNIGAAETDDVEPFDEKPRADLERRTLEIDHRRGQHEPGEGRVTTARLADEHCGGHAMAEREPRPRAEGFEDLLAQRDEIAFVNFKIVDMALAPVAELAFRKALTAPIQGDDGEAAGQQFGDRLEIVLDEFGAAGQNHDGAARLRPAVPAGGA